MSVSYEDALQHVLDAVRAGADLDSAIAQFPEHHEALRADARLAGDLFRVASAIASPAPEARVAASRRMLGQLAQERESTKPGRSFLSLRWPRYAVAAVLVAIAVVGAGLLLDRGGSTVEAATIEGVVVGNQDGTLTVQTLDALETMEVPADVPVSDVAGATIELGGIEVGQVVVVDLERHGREAVARRVQRFQDSIAAWCSDNPERCRLLTAGLDRAHAQCDRSPGACFVALDRLENLRVRASDSAALEELRQACRQGREGACRELIAFCREHLETCGGLSPQEPPVDRPMVEDRLQTLLSACNAGDEAACRQLAQHCNRFRDLCPADLAPPGPSPAGEPRPATAGDAVTPVPATATPRPTDLAPAHESTVATPARGLDDRPAPAPGLVTPPPAETPARGGDQAGAADATAPAPRSTATPALPRDVGPSAGVSSGAPANRPSDR